MRNPAPGCHDMGWERNGVFYSLIKSNIVNVPPAEPLGLTGQAKSVEQEQKLHKTITATTVRPVETVNELVEQMSFYMGIHEKL
jgi:hypothetical protein